MSGAEEFLESAFGKDSEDEKIEHFEQSTTKLLLRRVGWSAAKVHMTMSALGPAFGCDWFNDQGHLPFSIYVDRCFHFSLQDLLTNPKKSELLKQFHTKWKEENEEDIAVVYKAFSLGRIVISRQLTETSSRPFFPCVDTVIAPGVLVRVQLWNVFCNLHFGEENIDDE